MTYADVNAGDALAADFKFAAVISKSQRILLRNIVPFTALACAASLPFIGLNLAADLGIVSGALTNIFYSLLATAFLQAFAMAIILHTTFQHMRGRSARPVDAILRGITSSLAFLGMVLLQVLASRHGSRLLELTSLVLMVAWYFAMPVHVVEKIGLLKSLERGIALTGGFRWKILALFVSCYAIATAIDEALAVAAQASGSFWVNLCAGNVWESLSAGIGAVLLGVAYYELRVVKEGIDVERIGAVFD